MVGVMAFATVLAPVGATAQRRLAPRLSVDRRHRGQLGAVCGGMYIAKTATNGSRPATQQRDEGGKIPRPS